jgi:Zn-dependent oligopeptidase
VFDLSELVSGDNKVVLLAVEIENAGQIILDLFQREKRQSRVQNVSTLTERGSSFLRGQSGVAYVTAHLPREDIQYLTFEQTKTLFHEFGHAINIAISQTKYQYISGARLSMDVMEIPSHFAEHFLQDYDFVSQFAQLPVADKNGVWRMMPIKRSVFEKLLFCDSIFELVELEESLYFTQLDLHFHSFPN